MNEWGNEWTEYDPRLQHFNIEENEWMNELNELMNELNLIPRCDISIKKWMNEWMSKWMNWIWSHATTFQYKREWMNKLNNEWIEVDPRQQHFNIEINEFLNELTNELNM